MYVGQLGLELAAELGASAEHGEQIRAIDQLHDEEQAAIGGVEVVDLDDVRVIEVRRDARLLDEHRDEVGVRRQRGQHPLEHDRPIEPAHHRLGMEQLGHAA